MDHLKVTKLYASVLLKITCTTCSPGFTCANLRNFVVYISHIIVVSFCCLAYFRRVLTVKSY